MSVSCDFRAQFVPPLTQANASHCCETLSLNTALIPTILQLHILFKKCRINFLDSIKYKLSCISHLPITVSHTQLAKLSITMATDHILRIRQSDDANSFALVKVSQASEGKLDLTFEGTDGEYPFVGNSKSRSLPFLTSNFLLTTITVQHSRLAKFLSKKNTAITLPQWEEILSISLLEKPQTYLTSSLKIDVRANISSDHMTVAFHNDLSGIHQRIGEIPLAKNESHEIDTIAWTSIAVARSNSLSEQVHALDQQIVTYQDQAADLRKQLDDFLLKKKADEDVMLAKFCELLNYKKAKIRDQQYLLANAKVDEELGKDPDASSSSSSSTFPPTLTPTTTTTSSSSGTTECNTAARVKDARALVKRYKPSTSGLQKRKPDTALSDAESDSGAVKEEEEEVLYSGDDGPRTPSPEPDLAGDDTMSDLDSDDLDAGELNSDALGKGKSIRGKGKDRNTATADAGDRLRRSVLDSPPPRRELPFSKGKGKQDKLGGEGSTDQGKKPAEQDEDEDMTDDEL